MQAIIDLIGRPVSHLLPQYDPPPGRRGLARLRRGPARSPHAHGPADPAAPVDGVEQLHHHEPLLAGGDVRHVAARLKCSADYLSNLFRRETGQTLIAFIQRQRVAQARSLLESSSLSVKEAAVAVGYSDPGYFIRVFKRIAGQTPAAYRRSSLERVRLPESRV